MDRRAYATAAIAVILVGAAALIVSPSAILKPIDKLAAHPLYFGLALLALALVRPLLAWPTTLLAVAAGYGYEWWGLPVGLALMVVTSILPYQFAGRMEGGRFAEAGEQFVEATGDLRGIVSARFFPAPSDLVSIEAGLADIPFRTYILGTVIGETPWAIVGVLAGVSLESLSEGGSAASTLDPALVAAVALVGLLVIAEPAYQYLSGNDEENETDAEGESSEGVVEKPT